MNGITREDVTILFGFLQRIAEALEGPIAEAEAGTPPEPGAMTLEYVWSILEGVRTKVERHDEEHVKLWKALETEHEDMMEYLRDVQRS